MEHCETMLDTNSCPLLSLPQLALAAVLTCLESIDKHCLASTCRSLASSVSSVMKGWSVTITSYTRLAGLRQVLATRTLQCKRLVLNGATTSTQVAMPNAIDTLLGSDAAHGCEFHGIQKLTIWLPKDGNLTCLLPTNLARLLPDLQVLNVDKSCELDFCIGQPRPLPYCSGLRKIFLDGFNADRTLQMPECYTAEELRKKLPTVSELQFKVTLARPRHAVKQGHVCCVDTMLQAWGPQLSALDLKTDEASAKDVMFRLQHCTQLQSLDWHQWEPFRLLMGLPFSLTSMKLHTTIDESCLQCILQLPDLKFFSFEGFSNSLQHDWSDHPCAWQQLKIHELALIDLSTLPLNSLRGEGCLDIEFVTLPDPSECVIEANITVSGVQAYVCEAWKCTPVDHGADAATAELLNTLKSCVQFGTQYDVSSNIVCSCPRTTAALFRWSADSVRCVQVYTDHDSNLGIVQPWFWKALLCCSNLERVALEWHRDTNANVIGSTVLQACEHMMAARSTQLFLVFAARYDIEDAIMQLNVKLQEKTPAFVSIVRKGDNSASGCWVCTLMPYECKGN